jgi:Apea-like HEPN
MTTPAVDAPGSHNLLTMTGDLRQELVELLARFLGDAARAVDGEMKGSDGQLAVQAVAESLAALPACREAAAAARRAAAANGYHVSGVPKASRPAEPAAASEPDAAPDSTSAAAAEDDSAEPSGRPLNADVLASSGIVAMLLDGADVDTRRVAQDLAGYLAGPPIDIWDYAILDANFTTDLPIQVVDGWELVSPSAEELSELLPIPATGAYQPDRPFTPDEYGSLAMLRRVNSKARATYGGFFRFDVLYSLALRRPTHLLWQPLLALSLFDNPVIQLWARYQLEPGRRIDKLFDAVQWRIFTPDGVTQIDQPDTGEFGSGIDTPMLRRFLTELAPLLRRELRSKKAGTRLQRCAEHFLTAGDHAHGEGEVLSELNAETVLHYVIALEGLLAGSDSIGELTRKVSQRAAVLAGEDDAQRLEIEELVRDAYAARSKYAHGSTPTDELDLPRLRAVVRRCLLTRIVIGDPIRDVPLHVMADRALLSQEALERSIRQPFRDFAERVARP